MIFDHRDTMNTEKTKKTKIWGTDSWSLTADCSKRMRSIVVFSTAALRNRCASRGFWRCTMSHQPPKRIAADAWLLVPEGRRRKLAGGKPARAGAAPGCHARRAMPQRGIGERFWIGHPHPSPPPLVASDRSNCERLAGIPDYFFEAPLGHRATHHGFRGRRPLARTCPRLISSGVPPGRPTCSHALNLDTDGAGRALQTRSVAVLALCVHPISVVTIPVSTLPPRTR